MHHDISKVHLKCGVCHIIHPYRGDWRDGTNFLFGGTRDIFPLLHIDNLKTWLHSAYLKVITEGEGKQRKG